MTGYLYLYMYINVSFLCLVSSSQRVVIHQAHFARPEMLHCSRVIGKRGDSVRSGSAQVALHKQWMLLLPFVFPSGLVLGPGAVHLRNLNGE